MDDVIRQLEEVGQSLQNALPVTAEDKKRLANAVLQRVRTERPRATRKTVWKVGVPLVLASAAAVAFYVQSNVGQDLSPLTSASSRMNNIVFMEPMSTKMEVPHYDDTKPIEATIVGGSDLYRYETYHNKKTGDIRATVSYDKENRYLLSYYSAKEKVLYQIRYDQNHREIERTYEDSNVISQNQFQFLRNSDFNMSIRDMINRFSSGTEGHKESVEGVTVMRYDAPEGSYYLDPKTSIILRYELIMDPTTTKKSEFVPHYKTLQEKDLPTDWFKVLPGTYHKEGKPDRVVK